MGAFGVFLSFCKMEDIEVTSSSHSHWQHSKYTQKLVYTCMMHTQINCQMMNLQWFLSINKINIA